MVGVNRQGRGSELALEFCIENSGVSRMQRFAAVTGFECVHGKMGKIEW